MSLSLFHFYRLQNVLSVLGNRNSTEPLKHLRIKAEWRHCVHIPLELTSKCCSLLGIWAWVFGTGATIKLLLDVESPSAFFFFKSVKSMFFLLHSTEYVFPRRGVIPITNPDNCYFHGMSENFQYHLHTLKWI